MYNYQKNSYWSSYKQIETDLIQIAHSVYFDDNQLNVYSAKFSDMILSICSKIESVSKDFFELHLYQFYADGSKIIQYHKGKIKKIDQWRRKDWAFDYDCLSNIDDLLLLRKKVVNIHSHHFHFEEHTDEIIPFADIYSNNEYKFNGGRWMMYNKPRQIHLDNRRYEPVNWLKSYQEIKHNYSESFKKHGTLKNVIVSLAGLYLLLIYMDLYQSGTVLEPEYYNMDKVNNSFGSELFSVMDTNNTIPKSIQYDKGAYYNNDDNLFKDSCVLFRIYSKDTYGKLMKIINPYLVKANTDKIVFYIDSLSKEKNTEDEIILSDKIDDFYEKHRFIGHYRVVLNQNMEDVYSIYEFNYMNYEKEKYTNRRKQSLENMKVGDKISFETHLEVITGELLEKTDFYLKVRVDETLTHQEPISNMFSISIL
jgi:hypothetical protein